MNKKRSEEITRIDTRTFEIDLEELVITVEFTDDIPNDSQILTYLCWIVVDYSIDFDTTGFLDHLTKAIKS